MQSKISCFCCCPAAEIKTTDDAGRTNTNTNTVIQVDPSRRPNLAEETSTISAITEQPLRHQNNEIGFKRLAEVPQADQPKINTGHAEQQSQRTGSTVNPSTTQLPIADSNQNQPVSAITKQPLRHQNNDLEELAEVHQTDQPKINTGHAEQQSQRTGSTVNPSTKQLPIDDSNQNQPVSAITEQPLRHQNNDLEELAEVPQTDQPKINTGHAEQQSQRTGSTVNPSTTQLPIADSNQNQPVSAITEQPLRHQNNDLEELVEVPQTDQPKVQRTATTVIPSTTQLPIAANPYHSPPLNFPIQYNAPSACSYSNTNSFNVNFNGGTIFYRQFASDHYEGNFGDKKFVIRNGVVEFEPGTSNGTDQDKQMILSNLQQAVLGMQMGFMGLQAGLATLNSACSGFQKAIDANFGLNQFQNTIINQLGNQPQSTHREQMIIEDITELKTRSVGNEALYRSSVDGLRRPPMLEKTTFQPNELIIEDRKSYVNLDDLELEPALPDDRYIISMDESNGQTNVYYFHVAKPQRRIRKSLSAKELLKIASLNRFILFEIRSVQVHNELRARHGVASLVNNDFLCKVAREWAEHLALTNSFYHRPNNEYGENLYVAEGLSVSARSATQKWYDEIFLYDYDNPGFSKETGHFTQLIWKDTREMGTGVAQLGNKIWVCCNYHPPGNVSNQFNDIYVPRPRT